MHYILNSYYCYLLPIQNICSVLWCQNVTLGKERIIRFDKKVQDEFDAIKTKRRAMQSQLTEVIRDINQIQANMGSFVFEDCDYKEYLDRLAWLRLEQEALEAGVRFANNKVDALKRSNTWLRLSPRMGGL